MPDTSAERRPAKLIGVLGGTFDPVHVGHLRLAIEIREQLALDHVRVIPVGVPNHREPPHASAVQRVEMLLSLSGEPSLVVDQREIERGGVSYMADTLLSLRNDFPGAALCLVLGHDAYCGLPGWHRWRDLFDIAHIVVATRPDSGQIQSAELLEITRRRRADQANLQRSMSGLVTFQPITALSISSTDIRERCRSGRDLRYLVPQSVADIIERDKLYR